CARDVFGSGLDFW
nr:immunoglobulin heavy chain junction region [Macaca mulatta]MOX91650.1 immunoglobulin heavy chain junction region [Macaca mulatta]MOX91774.1 immunoglobulin heavy chain junction region [Macaca mulatta]MOX91850.1 immunoglobulin heavy chain junction region [Macaca mulatta]MOX91903.1 immunoglobulin heavy chain junction region [Macaca mulatta]